MGRYVNRTTGDREVQDRLSDAVVMRICDDDNDGEPDLSVLNRLISDAEDKFEGVCRGIYSLDALQANPPGEAIRLVLDGVEAFAAKRFPRAFSRDWQPLWDNWVKELKELRLGNTRLNVTGTPEPAANQGGEYYRQGESLSGDQPDSFQKDGFGGF